MKEFSIIPPRGFVGELMQLVPEFAVSEEYKLLEETDRTTPGIVFAQFTRFMEAFVLDRLILDKCTKAIELFASYGESEADNLLVTEVFENLTQPEFFRAAL